MSLYSTYWYRIADIKPCLRSHVHLSRHIYRNQAWYVLQDPSSSRQHRFNRTAYSIIGMMDGKRTLQQIWDAAVSTLADEAPDQDEVIRLLGQLHAADALQSDIPPDIQEMFQRQDSYRQKWKQRLKNPFALRFPLLDPDRFLLQWMFLVKPFFSRAALLLWLLVVGSAFVLALLHWPELTRNMADRVLTPKNLLLLWLVYPVVKLLHELAHAFATRIWGGEVHEMGIMFLALTPIPYVEASSSAAFSDKGRRMGVAAAGMAIELFVASLALFLWLTVESGRVSALAYNVMLIGGVSTVLFNGNPLLRFDAYYLLADWIEIPNLAGRSTRYLGYLLQRYLFGIEDAASPVTAPGESSWFVFYGIASFFYRLFVLAALALFVSNKFFFAGILLAFWALSTQLVLPLLRNCYRFFTSIAGRRKRKRLIAASLSIGMAATLLLCVVPAPLTTRVEGVVSLPEDSQVRPGTDCFISEILVEDGTMVQRGDALLRCNDPFLEAEVRVLEANVAESQARHNAVPIQSRVKREILKEEMASVHADLTRTRERRDELTIRSPGKGFFVLPEARTLVGHFVKQGTLLGYIMGTSEVTVVVVVKQSNIALVRERTQSIKLIFSGHMNAPLSVAIDREVPAASASLPSSVLGTVGGGSIPVDPTDPLGRQTLTKTFQLEIKLPSQQEEVRIGERVYALFDHGYEPLAQQWYRSLRHLFLRHFHV